MLAAAWIVSASLLAATPATVSDPPSNTNRARLSARPAATVVRAISPDTYSLPAIRIFETPTVTPRSFQGPRLPGCAGGSFGLRVAVAAPPGVRWTVLVTGFGSLADLYGRVRLNRSSGTGSGVLDLSITQRPATNGSQACAETTQLGIWTARLHFVFFDSSGHRIYEGTNLTTTVNWVTTIPTWAPSDDPIHDGSLGHDSQ